MTHDDPAAARVTLDVLHTGVIWGWYVTMNFWAKSISTGVFLLGAFFMKKSPARDFYRLMVPVVAFVFVNITLFFTVLDLHQPFRFWHMFTHPHLTSAIPNGAFLLTAYTGLTALLALLAWKRKDALYDRLIIPTWIVAFFSTIYTAALLGQANARELWHVPAEVTQMILAALLAGSAVFLLFKQVPEKERSGYAWVLGFSASLALTIYLSEVVFAPQKSEEAGYLIGLLLTGSLRTLFFSGLVFGFLVPLLIVFFGLKRGAPIVYPLAAVSSLVGLWLVKHAWLIAPQLIPLS